MDGFHSAAMKADRAEAALRQALALEAQWRSGVSLDMAATVEPSAHGFDAVVRLRNVPPVPHDIVLLLDDFFHHARSALDHVIWQLVIDAGTMPKKQQFPILSVNNTKSSKRLHIETEGLSEPLDRSWKWSSLTMPSTATDAHTCGGFIASTWSRSIDPFCLRPASMGRSGSR